MENMRLILLIGQSNMAGRSIPEEWDKCELPGIFAFTEDYRWVPAIEPISFDSPEICGVSCGRTFAAELYKLDPSTPIGLIPAAVGGTPLASWMPGGEDVLPERGKHPYDDAIRTAREACKYGKIIAVCWHQGETDAMLKNDNYAADLTTVVNNFRRELDIADVPFICGELGKFLKGSTDDYPAVNQGLIDVTSTLPMMALASSEGLTDKGDKLHFDTSSQHEFGRRYFAEYLKLINK